MAILMEFFYSIRFIIILHGYLPLELKLINPK